MLAALFQCRLRPRSTHQTKIKLQPNHQAIILPGCRISSLFAGPAQSHNGGPLHISNFQAGLHHKHHRSDKRWSVKLSVHVWSVNATYCRWHVTWTCGWPRWSSTTGMESPSKNASFMDNQILVRSSYVCMQVGTPAVQPTLPWPKQPNKPKRPLWKPVFFYGCVLSLSGIVFSCFLPSIATSCWPIYLWIIETS